MRAGRYITERGSTVHCETDNAGRWSAEFDWLEEGGCPDCTALDVDSVESLLMWECEQCGGGAAVLLPEQR